MLKKLCSLVILGGLFASCPTHATTHYLTLGTESAYSVSMGAFTDTLHFNLGTSSYVAAKITSLNYIKNVKIQLFNAKGVSQGSASSLGATYFGFTTPSVLPAASYYFTVTGQGLHARPLSPRNYGLHTQSIAVSPIPEPATLTLLSVGLGMITRRVRRKQNA